MEEGSMGRRDPQERVADVADLIVSIARKIGAHQPDMGAARLSALEALVLRCIDRRPGVSPAELGAELGLKSGNTSATLRALEEKGLLRRSPNPGDRRSVHVEPTRMLAENRERIRQGWVQVLEPRVPEGYDLDLIVRFLADLDDAFTAPV